MADETQQPAAGSVQASEADVANSGPAPWANRFIVTMGPMVRIAFLEQGGVGEPLYFRGAASMSHQDAIALKNLLVTMLADVEKQIQAAVQAHQPPQEPPANG